MNTQKDTFDTLIKEYLPEVPVSDVLVNTPRRTISILFNRVIQQANFVWGGIQENDPWLQSRPNITKQWVVSPLSLWPYLHNVAFLYGSNTISASCRYYSGESVCVLSNGQVCIKHESVDKYYVNGVDEHTPYDPVDGIQPARRAITDPLSAIVPSSEPLKKIPIKDLARELNRFSWWYLRRLIDRNGIPIGDTAHKSLMWVWADIVLSVEFTPSPNNVFLGRDLRFNLYHINGTDEPVWHRDTQPIGAEKWPNEK